MLHPRHLPWTVLLCLSLLPGCIVPFAAQPPPTGGDPGTDVAGGASTVTTTDPTSSFAGQLQQQFPDCGVTPSEAAFRQALFELVNQARADAGLAPVRHDQTLEDQATKYACELIEYDFFGHDNPYTGTTLADRATEFNYRYLVVGENLAAGQPTPEKAFEDWMNSPGHRANILDSRFTELGIGIRTGGLYGTYWVQEFGRPITEPYPRPVPR